MIVLKVLLGIVMYLMISLIVFIGLTLWLGRDVINSPHNQKMRMVNFITLQSIVWPILPLVLLLSAVYISAGKMIVYIVQKDDTRKERKRLRKAKKANKNA